MEAGTLIGVMAIMATLPTNLWAGNSKEEKIKELIQYFYDIFMTHQKKQG